jgi:hypothetical protein
LSPHQLATIGLAAGIFFVFLLDRRRQYGDDGLSKPFATEDPQGSSLHDYGKGTDSGLSSMLRSGLSEPRNFRPLACRAIQWVCALLAFTLTAATEGYYLVPELQAVVIFGVLSWLLSSVLLVGSILRATLHVEACSKSASLPLIFIIADALVALTCLISGSAALAKIGPGECVLGLGTICDLSRMRKAGAVSDDSHAHFTSECLRCTKTFSMHADFYAVHQLRLYGFRMPCRLCIAERNK